MRGFTDETTPHQALFQCFGVELRVCASDEEVLARIERHLPPNRVDGGSILTAHRMGVVSELDETFSVYNATTRVSEGGGLELALVTLEGQIRSYVSLHAAGLVVVRGAAVGHQGRAILLPGESFSGKSTLVASLVQLGADAYADDYTPIDSEGRVHPFPGSPAWGSDGAPSAAAGIEPLPVSLIVSTFFSPGAGWAPEQITGSAAALALISDTVTITSRSAEAMQSVRRVFENGAVLLKGPRGEADEVAPLILGQLAAHAPG